LHKLDKLHCTIERKEIARIGDIQYGSLLKKNSTVSYTCTNV